MVQISQLLELHELACQDGAKYPKKRSLYQVLSEHRGRHFVGLLGPRGVGKTVLLKQVAGSTENSIYLSLDSFDDSDLFETIKSLHQDLGVELFLLDEVHYYRGIEKVLKKTYDFLPVRVFFTSSVALAMQDAPHDLSRRVRLLTLLPFSLREYVYFKKDWSLPVLSLADIIERRWSRAQLNCSASFDDYLRGGMLPFALEEPDPLPLLSNILDTVLSSDIPRVARLRMDELEIVGKMVRFIGQAEVDGINYSSLSRNLGITKYKAESYIRILRDAFILRPVFPKGANVLREPKVLMAPPYRLLFKNYAQAIGGLREDFFAEMMSAAGLAFHYLKTKRGAKTPDFLVQRKDHELVIEIGGKGKGRTQFKGYSAKERLIFSHADSFDGLHRPLFLLGLIA